MTKMRSKPITQSEARHYEDLRITIDLTYDTLSGHWGATSYCSWTGRKRKLLSMETGDGVPSEGLIERTTIPAVTQVSRWVAVHFSRQLSMLDGNDQVLEKFCALATEAPPE